MNNAKDIYTEQNMAVSVRAVPALPILPTPKSILALVADFLRGPDLDLATFERIEGKSQSKANNTVESLRHMAGRL